MKKPVPVITLFLITSLIIPGCAGTRSRRSLPDVEIWMTKGDQSVLLERLDSVELELADSRGEDQKNVLRILEEQTFQEMGGFGASFTESSGYALSFLSPDDLNRVMNELFDPEAGIGISILRQPMGSADFALSTYSYDDIPPGETDFPLDHFSIEKDREYILPYLKQALDINPDLRIMASPWSPPAWMRNGDSMLGGEGGNLRRDCYDVYARYFVEFLKAYAVEGIPIFAVTSQNEPNYSPALYAGMKMTPDEEALFIGQYLGPALQEAGLDVRILCYDHNWDRPDLALATLADTEASNYLDGSAWHYYGGSPLAMTEIHEVYPDMEIWFTEGSTGTWIGRGSFSATFDHGMEQALAIVNNWSKSIIWWNVALDENNGPIVYPNTANHGLLQIDTVKGERILPDRASWYSLGHFSKFVETGALRIGVDADSMDINLAAFRNPDGEMVLVLYNRFFSSYSVAVEWRDLSFSVDIPPRSAVTCVWVADE